MSKEERVYFTPDEVESITEFIQKNKTGKKIVRKKFKDQIKYMVFRYIEDNS